MQINLNTDEERKAWKPYVNAVLCLYPVGDNQQYFIMNPGQLFSNRSALRNLLGRDRIENAEQLKEAIEWGISKGSRYKFEQHSRELSVLSGAERSRYIEAITDPKRKYELAVANSYLRRLPPAGIGAYDYTWMMFACFAGKELSYLTEDETWDYVAAIIPLIKQSFASWNEYVTSFAAGNTYLASDLRPNYVSQRKQHFIRLLNLPNSPLKQVTI